MRDVLRREHFGALHYRRADAAFEVLPPAWTSLLLDATHEHVMQAYKRDPRGIPYEDFIEEVARFRDRGILDATWRCPARVVEDPQPACLSAPLVTNLQVTRACNLSCKHCFVDVEARPHPDELSLPQLDTLFGELGAAGSLLVVLAGGEPMMRRDFWDVLAAAGAHDIDLALCTNANLIDDARAERLAASPVRWYSISLDGPDAEIHDKLRGRGAFEHVVRGVRALRRAGVQEVKLRVTVTAENADHLLRFAAVARDLDVPEIVFKPFRHAPGGEAWSSTHLYLSRKRYLACVDAAMAAWPDDAPPAAFDDGMPETLPRWTGVTPEFGCVGGTTHASVIYDGRVVACDGVHDPADWTLHAHGFLDAWRNAPTVQAWRRLKDDGECSACANFARCGGGCRVRALAAGGTMRDPDPWAYCEDHRGPPALPSRPARVRGRSIAEPHLG